MSIKAYIASDNIITSLGFTTDDNIEQLIEGNSGVKVSHDKNISPTPVPLSLVDKEKLKEISADIKNSGSYLLFEKLLILSIKDALARTKIKADSDDTIFIFSTTKGNINILESKGGIAIDKNRLNLWESARIVKEYFGNKNLPLVISNACISGVVAISQGARLIKEGRYKNVIVSGADIMSEFIVSGFQSFKAISPQQCRPFDINRDGISIGEGSGTIILTSDTEYINGDSQIFVAGGATSNDANHISGPSKTGDGLFYAITKSLKEADVRPTEIDFVSAHGTATPYNDEMEAKALALAGIKDSPVNSLKGYFGHTLGAAGIIESIVLINSLKRNILIKTLGYKEHGVSEKINVITDFEKKELKTGLKTASGFGGCNGAAVFIKTNV